MNENRLAARPRNNLGGTGIKSPVCLLAHRCNLLLTAARAVAILNLSSAPSSHSYFVPLSPERKKKHFWNSRDTVQGWAQEWSLGCVNSRTAARGSQKAGFTQPRNYSFAQPCILRISPNPMVFSATGCRGDPMVRF